MSHPSRLPKILLLLVAIVASLALSACGGDGDTTTTVIEETVTEGEVTDDTVADTDAESTTTTVEGPDGVTRAFLLALANGDGATACGYMSASAIQEVELQGSCEDAVVAAAGAATEEDVAQVESATYEVSEQTDTTAVVTATRADGNAETFNLVLEDGEWMVSN